MISNRDMFNIIGGVSQAAVDESNREFYGKITYPWPQMTYPCIPINRGEQNTMSFYLHQNKDESREFLADSFLQPIEHSYTIESLAALLESEGMELLHVHERV